MSQHTFNTTTSSGSRVQVLMGWDRPLQQFFLVVEELDAPENYDLGDGQETGDVPYLYSNLSDVDSMGMQDLDYFCEKLRGLGIAIPVLMVKEIEADQLNNVGNRYVTYNGDGSIRT